MKSGQRDKDTWSSASFEKEGGQVGGQKIKAIAHNWRLYPILLLLSFCSSASCCANLVGVLHALGCPCVKVLDFAQVFICLSMLSLIDELMSMCSS